MPARPARPPGLGRPPPAATAPQANEPHGASWLHAPRPTDKVPPVNRHCSPVLPPGISMSPDRQWLRSYPDRGGPVHQKRREKLMRRASTCLAVLGLVALGLPSMAAA